MDERIQRLIATQSGILARRQLTGIGMNWDAVHHQIVAGRWSARTPRVISCVTGALTIEQRRWVGVLHAGPRSMLGGLTAGARHGLVGWERSEVTVLVDDELSFEPVAGIRFFRSRRPYELLVSPKPGIPSCQIEPALLLWAGYDAALRPAHGVLAASVQQRLTTPARLREYVELLKPLRRASGFRRLIGDIEGGVHSGSERDVTTMCRSYGLPMPNRQVSRVDSDGRRRWTDCEWHLPDGRVLVLEVDGSFHMDVMQWSADKRRGRRISGRDRMIVGATAFEVRHEPGEVAKDLLALGVRRRVPGTAA
ncbi:hypothetical protein F0U44_03080 [Nocardioides humilatus]|uniref:DUF559 domain-containing protein n=1 Tax=Nocardioides humilatus TaxID=2607660 RepID=A0A5B1LNY1_9ACTN|nr:hypothetical protein [Nocardioides humilatus]KAA1421307.1 hypothetical protein F0U44_03080 [Nocardioides humilatus]